MKMDLLTNATVVDRAIRFISQKAKDKEKLIEESKEPDHDEDQDQLEEEQEEQTGEIAIKTNKVF
jgi:hypothetical protein